MEPVQLDAIPVGYELGTDTEEHERMSDAGTTRDELVVPILSPERITVPDKSDGPMPFDYGEDVTILKCCRRILITDEQRNLCRVHIASPCVAKEILSNNLQII